MTPKSNGRYCQSCDKVVRDFSKLSDTQLAYIIQNSNGAACGHFRKDQLNRAISVAKERRSPDLLAVVLGMTLLLSTYPAFASPTSEHTPKVSLIEMLQEPQNIPADGHEYIEIKLQLVDGDTKSPLAYVTLVLHDENDVAIAGATSDENGYLVFKLTPDEKAQAKYCKVRSFDFVERIIEWNEEWKSDMALVPVVELHQMDMMIDGMMIYQPIDED